MRPGAYVLQEDDCLLQPGSGSSSLQLNQCYDVGVRLDGVSRFQEIQKIPSLSQKVMHIILSYDCYVLIFFLYKEFKCPRTLV